MVSSSFLKEILGVTIGAVIITASVFFCPAEIRQKKNLIPPPPHLEYFSFGFQSVIADNLWIRTIQDFDYCEKEVSKSRCQRNSWLYLMLDAITNLSPDFKAAYVDGGVALSVVISDAEGATKIYEKGLRIFSDDFALLYRAGLHAYYDEKNLKKAADLYLKAARLQGLQGTWLYSLASRLYTDAGQKEVAYKLYVQMKDEGLDEAYLKRMREKLGLPDEE